RDVTRERAVLVAVLRRHGVRDPVAVAVPLVLGRFGDGDFVAGREIADDEIGSGILALLALAVLRVLLASALARAGASTGCRRAAAPGRPPPPGAPRRVRRLWRLRRRPCSTRPRSTTSQAA